MRRALWVALFGLWGAAAFAGPRDLLILPDEADRFSRGVDQPVVDAPWWLGFDDPMLERVIEEGISANPDVASADARVAQAQGAMWQGRAGLMPSVTADVSGSTAPLRSLGFQFGGLGGAPTEGLFYSYGVGIGAQWQVDLFGRSWLAYRASANEGDAAEADRDQFVMSLSATLGDAYFDVVSARRTEAVAIEQLGIASALLEVIELRYDRASAEGLDVLQQRSQAASAEVFVTQARMARELAEQRLAVLLARQPQNVVEGVADAFPALPTQPSVGTPTEMLSRRPDLVAAAERMDASSQRHQSSYSGVLPTVSLQADAGRDWLKTTETRSQNAWSAGGSIQLPIFNGGRANGAIRQARAGEYGAVASYGRLVLQAQGEVEGALTREAAMVERFDAVQRQAELSRLTFEQSQDRYLRGLDAFVNVLVAQNNLCAAETTLVTAERDVLAARVALHTALGGQWAASFGFEGEGR